MVVGRSRRNLRLSFDVCGRRPPRPQAAAEQRNTRRLQAAACCAAAGRRRATKPSTSAAAGRRRDETFDEIDEKKACRHAAACARLGSVSDEKF